MTPAKETTVREVLNSHRFQDMFPYEVYGTLLDENGRYLCSVRTMYRILKKHGETTPRGRQRVHTSYKKPELLATAPRVLAIQAVGSDIEAALNGETQDISGALLLDETSDMVVDTTQAFNRMMGATYVTLADGSAQDLGETGLVRTYPDSPRITITAFKLEARQTVTETQYISTQGLDLLHDHLRGIAYPGQAKNAEQVYQMARGMNDTFLEKSVGEDGTHQFLVEAAFWMLIFALTITLLTILIDILMARLRWQEAIEMTWNAFWEEVVRQTSGADANDPSTLPYQDILQATKAYMNSNPHVWPAGFDP